MIKLGLGRIVRLLKGVPINWKAVHVAGTNGKGTVCATTASILNAHGIKTGLYTSPHLLEHRDSIQIGGNVVSRSLFSATEAWVKRRNHSQTIKATEFEILTATAFMVFQYEQVDIAIVEVGLGGRNDATNIIAQPTVAIITKIGMDHETLLGDTLEAIAYQKAGILKEDVPCYMDGSNPPNVIEVVQTYARLISAKSAIAVQPDMTSLENLSSRKLISSQAMNFHLSIIAAKTVIEDLGHTIDYSLVEHCLRTEQWPGRLHDISAASLMGHNGMLLLDGAHNELGAATLNDFVEKNVRDRHSSMVWLVGFSEGKSCEEIMGKLVRSKDEVFITAFNPVENMPWIKSMHPEVVQNRLDKVLRCHSVKAGSMTATKALGMAVKAAQGRPIVVTGSLYLIADILKMQKEA